MVVQAVSGGSGDWDPSVRARLRLFNLLDGYLNPLFNRARDSLLNPDELAWARALADRAAERDFVER